MKSLGEKRPEIKDSLASEGQIYDKLATFSEEIDFSKVKVEPLFEEFVDFETFSKSDLFPAGHLPVSFCTQDIFQEFSKHQALVGFFADRDNV